MKVRIGIAESDKVVEIEVDDAEGFKSTLANALGSGEMAWFTDVKGRQVGIPATRLAYVEVDAEDSPHSVGFAPAV